MSEHGPARARSAEGDVPTLPPPWPTPLRDLMQDPTAGDFTWAQLRYVFELANPSELDPAAVVLPAGDRAKLDRFVHVTRQLAASSLLAAVDSVTISIAHDGADAVLATSFSAPDLTTGFMVLLRQCYASGEDASFARTQGLLMKALGAADDAATGDVVRQWRAAHGKLMNTSLAELVQEKMVVDRLMPGQAVGRGGEVTSLIVRGPASPDELLRTHWYGDQIHWGDYRDALGESRANEFDAARHDLAVRQVASDLAFFYCGFALVIERVVDRSTTA